MPSAPKASFTPSKSPMFNWEEDDSVLDEAQAGEGTKACAHDVVAAATRRDDFIAKTIICFSGLPKLNEVYRGDFVV